MSVGRIGPAVIAETRTQSAQGQRQGAADESQDQETGDCRIQPCWSVKPAALPGGRALQQHRNGRPTHHLVRDAPE